MPLTASIKNALQPIRSALSTATLRVHNRSVGGGKDIGWLPRDAALSGDNPIVTANDVTDYGDVSFVADPFLYVSDETWHLLFEVQNGRRSPTAVIGHAASTDEGSTWEYDRIVLDIGRHLSFPYVFEHEGEIYMVPGQGGTPEDRPVTLFRATTFPRKWERIVDIVTPEYGPLDPVVFHYGERWWVVVGGHDNDCLYAYYSDTLESADWTPHAENPVVTDRVRAGRPAGRPMISEEGPILYLQDNADQYGDKVRAFLVTELTPERYRDEPLREGSMMAGHGGLGWNGGRMHHVDAQLVEGDRWVCITDGDVNFGRSVAGSCWSIGCFELTAPPVAGDVTKTTVRPFLEGPESDHDDVEASRRGRVEGLVD